MIGVVKKTFMGWLKNEPEDASDIYKRYAGRIENCTSEEKGILRKAGFQVDRPTNKIIIISS